ncbi:unnamed protein product [Choristocarpus tenellus]
MIGKALKDGRMLDLPLARPLCSMLVGIGRMGQGWRHAHRYDYGVGQGRPLTLSDVGLVDENLGRSLEQVVALAKEVERSKACLVQSNTSQVKSSLPPPRSMEELKKCVEDMCLMWTPPGSPW